MDVYGLAGHSRVPWGLEHALVGLMSATTRARRLKAHAERRALCCDSLKVIEESRLLPLPQTYSNDVSSVSVEVFRRLTQLYRSRSDCCYMCRDITCLASPPAPDLKVLGKTDLPSCLCFYQHNFSMFIGIPQASYNCNEELHCQYEDPLEALKLTDQT